MLKLYQMNERNNEKQIIKSEDLKNGYKSDFRAIITNLTVFDDLKLDEIYNYNVKLKIITKSLTNGERGVFLLLRDSKFDISFNFLLEMNIYLEKKFEIDDFIVITKFKIYEISSSKMDILHSKIDPFNIIGKSNDTRVKLIKIIDCFKYIPKPDNIFEEIEKSNIIDEILLDTNNKILNNELKLNEENYTDDKKSKNELNIKCSDLSKINPTLLEIVKSDFSFNLLINKIDENQDSFIYFVSDINDLITPFVMNKSINIQQDIFKIGSIIKIITPKIVSKKFVFDNIELNDKFNDKFYLEYSNSTKFQILVDGSNDFKNVIINKTNFCEKRVENKSKPNATNISDSTSEYKYDISYNLIPDKIVFPVSLNRIGEFKLAGINVIGVIIEISELEKRKVGLDEVDIRKIMIIDGSLEHNHDIIKIELCLWRDKALLNLNLNDVIIADNIKVSTFKGNYYLSQQFDTTLHIVKKEEMNRIINIVKNKDFKDNFKNLSFSDLKIITEMIVNCMKNRKLNDPFDFGYNSKSIK